METFWRIIDECCQMNVVLTFICPSRCLQELNAASCTCLVQCSWRNDKAQKVVNRDILIILDHYYYFSNAVVKPRTRK